MDATHIHWAKCPASHKHDCTGKEGYPTIAFNIAVTHSGHITSVTNGFHRGKNDKSFFF